MSALDGFFNVETNVAVKMLAQESDIDYLDQTIQFCFCLAVMRTCKGGMVTRVMRTLVRAYAGLAFVLPLMLNGLPSQMMKDMDHFALMVVAAMVADRVPLGRVHPRLETALNMLCDLSYCVMKANAYAAGYTAFAAAFGGSNVAPFLGGFLATNGHRLVEDGMGAFKVSITGKGTRDDKLAALGGFVLMVASAQLNLSAMAARGLLAFLVYAEQYTQSDKAIGAVQNAVSKALGGVTALAKAGSPSKMKMRGRSRTPSKMKMK